MSRMQSLQELSRRTCSSYSRGCRSCCWRRAKQPRCAGGQMAQKGQKTTNCEHFAAMPEKTLLIRPSQSLPLVALLLSDFAHAVLVDENVGETAGEHDSEQLDHGQDGAGDGEYRQDRNDVILQHFSAAHFQVGSQRLWFIPVRCTPLPRCNRGRGSS